MKNIINKFPAFSLRNRIINPYSQRIEPYVQCFVNSTKDKIAVLYDLSSDEYFNHIKNNNKQQLLHYRGQQIEVRLKDGKIVKAEALKTTPYQITKLISNKLAETAIAVKIKYSKKSQSPFKTTPVDVQGISHTSQYQIADLFAPLEGDCQVQFITFQHQQGKEIFWHSSAHILGQALQNIYGAWLCHGPPINAGFFYDSFTNQTISQADYQTIEKEVKKYIQEKQKFQRIFLSKQEALTMFQGNLFKQYLIKTKIPDGGLTSAYKCGSLVDLCTGPHLPSTEMIKGFKIVKNSSSYFLGNKNNDNLQRVYAISFPKQAELNAYLKNQQQLAKRDHRVIGPKQQLFNFTNLSPGSALFLPHGTIIYNRLIELMRSQYNIRGYKEVISPNLYHAQLWKMSGHYFKYKQNMFIINSGEEEQGLKPMNCPGHCLIFDQTQYSYRDLPIRMADFGVLHRNELTGALSGLTRVRRFQQDDAHIFCRPDQIETEILAVLDLLHYVYTLFGFKYVLELSTRPQKFLGRIQEWEKAESQLKEALLKFGRDYKLNEGDGAFYGPKIDVKLFDACGREHQCGTIQLDFQLPIRFNLQYRCGDKQKKEHDPAQQHHCSQSSPEQEKYGEAKPLKNGFERPVIIHRAIFGSLERFIAILCEHNGGKWDFWLSPRQIKLLSIGKEAQPFLDKIQSTLILKGYSVEKDLSQDNIGKKIRNAQMEGFNYMAIIGAQEVKSGEINIRKRDGGQSRMKLSDLIEELQGLKPERSNKRKDLQRRAAE